MIEIYYNKYKCQDITFASETKIKDEAVVLDWI